MNKTIDELISYCKEADPVGALLLTGEWGCGKTYLINHELKKALEKDAIIIRISLFGISNIEDIHIAVKQTWIVELNKGKKYDKAANKIFKGKEKIAKLDFLPDWLKGVMTTDWLSFVEITTCINEKPVILVFDDLERCCLDTIEVLGAINDYCENRKFPTIIVANQAKVKSVSNNVDITSVDAEINCIENESKKNISKKYIAKIKPILKSEAVELSYTEIKEKIIHRTVQYMPDYESVVHAVIQNMKYQELEYKKFVQGCEREILELFAPDRNTYDKFHESKRPHNIRSLKCAIRDFYRVFVVLRENDFQDLGKWFYNFTVYIIAYKAGIAKEGIYGTIFTDEEVRKLYPAFQTKYVFVAVKKWILHGIWDKEALEYEIEIIQEQNKAVTPEDIVRTYRIMDIDEDVFMQGFPQVVDRAYSGNLSLDEYVYFIQNSCWARYYHFELPIEVEWEKVRKGLLLSIQKLLEVRKEGQQLHSTIGEDNKENFTDEECQTYQIIEKFMTGNSLMFSNNRSVYIETMKKEGNATFSVCQNKRFDVFDEEMASVTSEAFGRSNNYDKHQFVDYFKDMWRSNIISPDIKVKESILGLNKLIELLVMQKKEFEKERKVFALCHTEEFIKGVNKMIEQLENIL